MKSTAIIVPVLASVAVAQPHLGHHRRAHHQHPHDKRALEIVWETEWVTEFVTAFVDEVTTEYVQATPTPESISTSSSTTTIISVPTSTSKAVPAEFFPSSSSVAPVPSPATTHTTLTPIVVPTPTSTSVAIETSVYVPPVQSSSSSPVVQAVVSSTSSSAPAATSQASSGNGGGSAPSGSKYTGEMTYYAIGMGACGFDDSGKDQTDHVVALSSQLMGVQSNGNPMCGKTITITNGDVTTTAQVRDKCPSCATGAIDVSEAVFKLVFGGLDAGRKPVTWWFNE